VGYNDTWVGTPGGGWRVPHTVSESYSTAMVTGGVDVGGLVGTNVGSVSHCYSAGAVIGRGDGVGGLIGEGSVPYGYMGESIEGTVTACLWDIQTSGQTGSAGGIGLTTREMQDIRTYQNAGWDFAGEMKDGLHEIWQMPTGGGHPVLAVFYGYTPPQLRGSGTPEGPFLISDATELGAVVYYDSSAHYRLVASINLSGIRWGTAVIPLLSSGTFDGNGLAIMNLTIRGAEHLGLFGRLEYGGEIRNLALVDANVSGSGEYIGALVGENYRSNVTACYSSGMVSGGSDVGGLVGYNNYGSIICCYSTNAVRGGYSVGGLVGSNLWADVTYCYSTGVVSGSGAGWSGRSGSIGGLLGTNIHGDEVAGCFWDIQTSGQITSGGGIGKTTTEMRAIHTYRDAGWDFIGEIKDGLHEIWQMPEGGGYPVLTVFHGYVPPELKGRGTQKDPYLISNAIELGAIRHHNCRGYCCLVGSMDLSGIRWGMAVIPRFAGIFDGKGHTIGNLHIQGNGDLGLFGRLESGATVKDVGLTDVNITGSGDGIAALAASNSGDVIRCHSTGLVGATGQWSGPVAGLVGWNGGSVTCSYSAGTVSGWRYAGGLVGANYGSIICCYSTNAVRGGYSVGGFVGDTGDYNGQVIACFWDIQTSGHTASDGGTGKTTAEMKTARTFLEVGWDFVGETANGTEDIWWILEGQDYPRLWWEAHD